VTLDDISELVKRGDDVKVMDNTTGEDLTSMTMTQILLEKERSRKIVLPIDTLRGIIRSGGESLHELVDKIFQSPDGTIAQVKREANVQIQKILKKDLPADPRAMLADLINLSQKRYEELQKKIDHAITEAVDKLTGLSETQKKIEELTRKVETLEKKLGGNKAKRPKR
jgi:polyhydroxyalkanoate synthesis regulator protein